MFKTPTKLLLIAVDGDDKPLWGASVAPTNISLDYETASISGTFGSLPMRTEIDVRGVLLDGPVPIEQILEDISGLT